MNNERDSFEDLFRTKLKDLEAGAPAGSWDAIEKRLPEPKVYPMRKRWAYSVAVVLLILCLGGGRLYWQLLRQTENLPANHAQLTVPPTGTGNNHDKSITLPSGDIQPEAIIPVERINIPATLSPTREVTFAEETVTNPSLDGNYGIYPQRTGAPAIPGIPVPLPPSPLLIADAGHSKKQLTRGPTRKWSFGTGFGGLTAGSNNIANTYLLRTSNLVDRNLMALNAPIDFNSGTIPQTDIKHKMPISFGLSASRYINDRWSIQTGLSYTLQRSKWETQGIYYNKTKQHLHFIGIPLALTYKVAEWNKFLAYASAGGMGEINVAGREKTDSYVNGKKISKDDDLSVRMKELQWSVSGRVGVSYPLIRFISAYVEVGASYYFDNGSEIKTIYSDKPLNISPQFGLRFGF